MSLFDGIHYHLPPSLPPHSRELVKHLLDRNGGQEAELPDVDYIITDTNRFEGWQDLVLSSPSKKLKQKAVTLTWVKHSAILGKMQPAQFYSPDPAMLFSGVVACATKLPVQDLEVLSAGILALGGQWRTGLTKDVTHLFAIRASPITDGDNPADVQKMLQENMSGGATKYATAMHFKPQTGVKIVLPHWFDDCVRLGLPNLDTTPYEWPNPPLLRNDQLLASPPPPPHLLADLDLPEGTKEEREARLKQAKEKAKQVKKATANEKIDAMKKSVFLNGVRYTPNGPLASGPYANLDLDGEEGPSIRASSPTVVGDEGEVGPSVRIRGDRSSPLKPAAGESATLRTKNVWKGRRIILARNLRLVGRRREAVEVGIRRAGGVVVRWEGDEDMVEVPEDLVSAVNAANADASMLAPNSSVRIGPRKSPSRMSAPERKELDRKEGMLNQLRRKERALDRIEARVVKEGQVDVYVCRWREGRGYVEAFQKHRTIGTLAWLYHVQSTGVVTRPLDQLLHYPIPKRRIEGFNAHEITVTNYTGEAREYLKKLITTMGARFTPSMSGKNTVLIAATKDSTKAQKAMSWSIPVVNHTWLEDCFVQWRNLTPGTEKYQRFPEGVDFSEVLGERGVDSGGFGCVGGLYGDGDVNANASNKEGKKIGNGVGGKGKKKAMIEGEADELAEGYEVEDEVDGEGGEEYVDVDIDAIMDVESDIEQDGDIDMDVGASGKSRAVEPSGTAELRELEEVQALFDEDEVGAEDEDEPGVRGTPLGKAKGVARKMKGKSPIKPGGGSAKGGDKSREKVSPSKSKSKDGSPTKPRSKGEAVRKRLEDEANAMDVYEVRRGESDEEEEDERQVDKGKEKEKEKQRQKKKQKSTPRKPVRERVESEEDEVEEEEDDDPEESVVVKAKTRGGKAATNGVGTPKSAPKTKGKKKETEREREKRRSPSLPPPASSSDESEAEIVRVVNRIAKVKQRERGAEREREEAEREEEEEAERKRDKEKGKGKVAKKSAGDANTKGVGDASTKAKKGRASGGGAKRVVSEDESELSEVEVGAKNRKQAGTVVAKGAGGGKAKVKRVARDRAESGTEEEDEDEGGAVQEKSKGVGAAKARNAATVTPVKRVVSVVLPTLELSLERKRKEREREMAVAKKKTKSGGNGKGGQRNVSKSETGDEVDEDEDEESDIVVPKSRSSVKKAKAIEKPERQSKPKVVAKGKGKAGAHQDEDDSTGEEEEEDEKTLPAKKSKATAVKATAPAAKAKGKHKNPAEKEKPKSTRHALPSENEDDDDRMEVDGVAGPSRLGTTTTASSRPASSAATTNQAANEVLPRRSAATKANARLRDELMPDLMNFESQMKKSKASKKGRMSDFFVVEGDTPPVVSRGKAKVKDEDDSTTTGSKKRRLSGPGKVGSEGAGQDDEREETETEVRGKKKRRFSDGNAQADAGAKAASKQKQADVGPTSKSDPKDVRILTTAVKIDEYTKKALVALGVKFTDRHQDCTHLVAAGLVRTEKFLCALARAPYILKEDWVKDSAKVKRLLPEDDYLLHDAKGEAKYGLILEEALERARDHRGTLLKGKTFYLTPKINVGIQLMKNVITACGGQVAPTQPTPRILKSSPGLRHVISCPEDVHVWRALVEHGFPIYSQELILTGVLRQEISWDDAVFRVDLER
ncbi:hypothetical protein FA15DRAFT_761050 [Coprinopsis marcescibilis]|uniref:BRCT domain-containing protein n=1 Tax=Coprinopsis marcescibilis TaxID=230819 RepID=A0A5C3KCU1_COPMA|nr:hypothetical protein FA15DRAFT_761050 [Coprinopsis marcescibilis]